MFIYVEICVILMVGYVTAEVEHDPITSESHIKGVFAPKRGQRSVISIGLFGVKKLLQGATEFSSSEFQIVFRKIGSYRNALSDFNSVNPTDVRSVKMVNGRLAKEGTINGDTKIYLFKGGYDGRTTLDIIKTGNPKTPMLTIKYRF